MSEGPAAPVPLAPVPVIWVGFMPVLFPVGLGKPDTDGSVIIGATEVVMVTRVVFWVGVRTGTTVGMSVEDVFVMMGPTVKVSEVVVELNVGGRRVGKGASVEVVFMVELML